MSGIVLSFCTPVMNRLSDLQSTLRRNLDDNREHQEKIEFVVVCFDRDAVTATWVKRNFSEEIASGYLRFYQSTSLKKWHFGRAKNAFRGLLRGRIYASLDGDNFTGPAGGKHIIEVFEAYEYNCIFHQFQGDWGDGTCGRVSMTREDYETIGYDEYLLARQWDELDAILTILVQNPLRRYICYQGKSIATKSWPFKRFIQENDIKIHTIELDGKLDPLLHARSGVSVGKHKSSYVHDNEELKYSSIFNHLSSFCKNTRDDALCNSYINELVDIQRIIAERLDPMLVTEWFLSPQQEKSPVLNKDDVILVACVCNEVHLDAWLNHYRRLGVTHFLLIDDDSREPISNYINSKDVWVWKPKCGKFRYSKAFWMELLLRRYACGKWVVTVDSDEYLDLPGMPHFYWNTTDDAKCNVLRLLTSWASSQNIRYFAGCLIDLIPGPESISLLRSEQVLKHDDFVRYQFRPTSSSPVYQKHNTVRWSYGAHSEWAYRIDIRFRINRAIDSLRKFPVFLMNTDVQINQGFHDLIISGKKRSSNEMCRSDLLIICHYKLLNIQLNTEKNSTRPVDAYHQETQENIKRMQANLKYILKNAAICPFTYPFLGHMLLPVPGKINISIRAMDLKNHNISYGKMLNRLADIPVKIKDISARYNNYVIEARSIREAVLWIMGTTPYNEIVALDSAHATLKINQI